jgi:nucleoside-diphosphate-sugar epimerase
VDAFTDYYDASLKRRNITGLLANPRFRLIEGDVVDADLTSVLATSDVVFHLAGQPGVRSSWADGFAEYARANVVATQRMLEGAKRAGVQRFVYASSSSVYGNAANYPCVETDIPKPHSPYGVTKLAGEHLACLYASNYGLHTVSLRYFTVFGPRQRPEMAFSRIFEAALTGDPFTLFAASGAVRDFTFVDDVVDATVRAGLTPDLEPGTVLNISGGAPTTMNAVLESVSQLVGRAVPVSPAPPQAGDVVKTGGDNSRAKRLLGWVPAITLREGLRRQLAWCLERETEAVSLVPTQRPELLVDRRELQAQPVLEAP